MFTISTTKRLLFGSLILLAILVIGAGSKKTPTPSPAEQISNDLAPFYQDPLAVQRSNGLYLYPALHPINTIAPPVMERTKNGKKQRKGKKKNKAGRRFRLQNRPQPPQPRRYKNLYILERKVNTTINLDDIDVSMYGGDRLKHNNAVLGRGVPSNPLKTASSSNLSPSNLPPISYDEGHPYVSIFTALAVLILVLICFVCVVKLLKRTYRSIQEDRMRLRPQSAGRGNVNNANSNNNTANNSEPDVEMGLINEGVATSASSGVSPIPPSAIPAFPVFPPPPVVPVVPTPPSSTSSPLYQSVLPLYPEYSDYPTAPPTLPPPPASLVSSLDPADSDIWPAIPTAAVVFVPRVKQHQHQPNHSNKSGPHRHSVRRSRKIKKYETARGQ